MKIFDLIKFFYSNTHESKYSEINLNEFNIFYYKYKFHFRHLQFFNLLIIFLCDVVANRIAMVPLWQLLELTMTVEKILRNLHDSGRLKII